MTNKKLKMAAMSVALTACVAASPLAANADAPEAAPGELKKEPVAEETKKEENTAEPQDNKQSEKAQETLKDAEVKYNKDNPTTNPDGSQKLDGVIVTNPEGSGKTDPNPNPGSGETGSEEKKPEEIKPEEKKPEEVKNGIVGLNVPDDLLPCVGSKHLSGFDRLGDELCALSKDLTGTESVVTDLGVAHIVIGGKPDGSAVSLERYMRIFCHKHIEGRGVSCRNSISFARGSYADSVHDYREKRPLHAAEMRIFLENLVHCNVRFSGVFSVLGNLQPAARRNHRPSLYNTYYKPQL